MSKLTRALAELAKRADAGDQAARQAIRPTKKTIDDFSNEDSFYRIVDEDAYIDLVNSGAVRTNFGNKPGSTINDKLASRPTRYPSFSKGSANKTYAEGKPNHYIIETKDPSIKPSTEGRHGKGTTQFPTDSTGVHLESLPGEAVQVYRHIGDGQYRLVYDQGKVTPKATNAETNVAAPLGNISVPIAAAIAAGTMTPEEAQAGPGQGQALAELAKRADAGDEAARQGIRPLDTMINYARQGMSKANIKKLDSQIKKVIPGWTSVMDPEVNAMFRNVGGNQRKIIANIIDKNFRDVPGGLSMGEARAATSDIAQYTSPDGSLLNVGRIDTSQAPIADSGHSTYKGGLVGEGIGRLTEDLDVRPFMAARGRELTGGPEDIRSLSMNPAFSQGVVDEKLLRNIYDTQSGRLQEIATKYGVSIPVAAMALMGDAEEASASDIQANQGLVPFDKDIHTPRDVGFGGPSTEYTMTVDAPDGQVAVIPSIWWDTNGEPVVLDQRDAERRSFEYEQETGKQFPRFPAGDYELADEYAQARTRQGGASESPLASEYPSLGGMGVRMPPTAEDEEAMLAPTGGDLMQQANRDFADSIRTQPEPDFLTGVQQSLLSGIMKTAGVADLSADVVSAMAGPLLSAPGAIARYAADRYVPGVNYSAEEMAQGRRETEDYFNYQPRTEQGPQYGEQIMQGIGGAIAPYVPAIKKAAGDSYILGAMRQGYDYLGEREKELAKALMDLSPI
jgi:hypothetical protein